MWQMIGVLTGLECSLISERTRAGVKATESRGVKFVFYGLGNSSVS